MHFGYRVDLLSHDRRAAATTLRRRNLLKRTVIVDLPPHVRRHTDSITIQVCSARVRLGRGAVRVAMRADLWVPKAARTDARQSSRSRHNRHSTHDARQSVGVAIDNRTTSPR